MKQRGSVEEHDKDQPKGYLGSVGGGGAESQIM